MSQSYYFNVFHPSTTNRIVVGGDTTGNVGIWLVDEQNNDTKEEEDDDEPSISILQLHGRNVSKIMTPTFSPERFIPVHMMEVFEF